MTRVSLARVVPRRIVLDFAKIQREREREEKERKNRTTLEFSEAPREPGGEEQLPGKGKIRDTRRRNERVNKQTGENSETEGKETTKRGVWGERTKATRLRERERERERERKGESAPRGCESNVEVAIVLLFAVTQTPFISATCCARARVVAAPNGKNND